MKHMLKTLLIISCYITYGQQNQNYLAIVQSYNGVPVYYNCIPLHPYRTIATGTGEAMINNLSQALEKYARAAGDSYPNCTGIIIRNVRLGTDTFMVVQALQPNINEDTAVFSTPIVVDAKPIGKYDIITIIKGKADWGSLNSNLLRYYRKAKKQSPDCDGIIISDVNYAFLRDDIVVFRWRK